MKLADGSHLTYCTNIHPGETLAEVVAMLEQDVAAVRRGLGLDASMGVGLRLSAQAALELDRPDVLARFAAMLDRLGLYLFTLNGFPYGRFHGSPVKDGVYRPDWRQPERLDYSDRLARILCRLLPDGVDGSVSTVPGAYKAHLNGEDDLPAMIQALARHAVTLHRLHQESGRRIILALEPEPGCLLESIAETTSFFRDRLFGREGVTSAARLAGVGRDQAEALLRRHLGLCLDACHAAVGFEDPVQILDSLRDAGITIAKIQLSAGLEVTRPGAAERAALQPFAEDIYLHQVTALRDGRSIRYADLPDALADTTAADLWRIHFHVPLWASRLDGIATTAGWLEQLLAAHRRHPVAPHLEIETYTWSVLDPRFRPSDLPSAIVKEIQWVRDRLL